MMVAVVPVKVGEGQRDAEVQRPHLMPPSDGDEKRVARKKGDVEHSSLREIRESIGVERGALDVRDGAEYMNVIVHCIRLDGWNELDDLSSDHLHQEIVGEVMMHRRNGSSRADPHQAVTIVRIRIQITVDCSHIVSDTGESGIVVRRVIGGHVQSIVGTVRPGYLVHEFDKWHLAEVTILVNLVIWIVISVGLNLNDLIADAGFEKTECPAASSAFAASVPIAARPELPALLPIDRPAQGGRA